MPRRKPAQIVGLTDRGGRAYYHRSLPQAVGGDRIYKSLEADTGTQLAAERAMAIGQYWNRGDWNILRRWASGEIHVSDLVRAVREGGYERLRRLNLDGYLLGRGVSEHMARTEATRQPGTIRNHRVVCDALLEAFGADRPMHDITKAEAEGFLHAPKDTNGGQPWSENTQRQYRMVASALWNFVIGREAEEAEKAGAVPTVKRNPWSKARVREGRNIKPNVLTAEEVDDLLPEPGHVTPAATLVSIAFLAGLRQAEITNLRTAVDVDLWDAPTETQAGWLHVQSRKGELAWESKTDNSDRRVPIVPRLGRILREHMERGFAGRNYFIRPSQADKPVTQHTAARWTRQWYEAHGIRYGRDHGDALTLHHGRHTCATLLLSGGVSIAVVAEWLGDTQETVLKTYSHALPRDRELAMRVLEGGR